MLYSGAISVPITLALYFGLIPPFHAWGAAVGSSVSYGLTGLDLALLLPPCHLAPAEGDVRTAGGGHRGLRRPRPTGTRSAGTSVTSAMPIQPSTFATARREQWFAVGLPHTGGRHDLDFHDEARHLTKPQDRVLSVRAADVARGDVISPFDQNLLLVLATDIVEKNRAVARKSFPHDGQQSVAATLRPTRRAIAHNQRERWHRCRVDVIPTKVPVIAERRSAKMRD